jgi:excisionase family DNA binding protein
MDWVEVAEALHISPHSVRGKVFRKELPHIRIGRRVLFSPSAIEAYLRANSVEAIVKKAK